MGTGPPMG